MPIEVIKFKKLFPTVQYGNEEFSMEATIGPNETKEQLYDEMYKTALAQFQRNNPHLAESIQLDGPLPPEPPILPTVTIDREIGGDKILEGILSAADASDLSGYKLLVKNNFVWSEAYSKRAKELGVIA